MTDKEVVKLEGKINFILGLALFIFLTYLNWFHHESFMNIFGWVGWIISFGFSGYLMGTGGAKWSFG